MLNLLCAYSQVLNPRERNKTFALFKYLERDVRVMVDSGAYTAMRLAINLTVDAYSRFLLSLPITPYCYSSLDVIGHGEKSHQNYLSMKREYGLKPLPVFTKGMDRALFDEYYNETGYVALGSISPPRLIWYFKEMINYTRGKKTHWFGRSDPKLMPVFRPHSVDSTGFKAYRMARLPLYVGGGQRKWITRATFGRGRPPQALLDRIEALGLDPLALAKERAWRDNKFMATLCFRSEVLRMMYCEEKLGIIFFLGITGAGDLRALWDAYEFCRTVKLV